MTKEVRSSGDRWIRGSFATLSWLFFICIIIQVFLAGIAIFVHKGYWGYHEQFVHYFEFVPVVMLILSFFGGIPNFLRWQSFGLFFMIILQYITANLAGTMPYLSAFHPIIALVLFWRALVTAQESKKLLKTKK